MDINTKNSYVYDTEIFPNFLLFIFKNIENNEFNIFQFYGDGLQTENIKNLVSFLNQVKTLIGFNNICYDNIVLNCFLQKKNIRDAKLVSDSIITEGKRARLETFPAFPNIASVDVLQILDCKASLKFLECSYLKSDMIDLSISFDKSITNQNDIDNIIFYCQHDVLSTEKLYFSDLVQEKIKIKEALQTQYGLNSYSYSESEFATKILCKEIKNLSSPKILKFYGKDIINPDIKFALPELQTLLESCKNYQYDYTGTPKKFTKRVIINNNFEVNFGAGGIHGDRIQNNKKIPYVGKDIIELDATSFYPSIVLLEKIAPAPCKSQFLEVYKSIVEKRITAKKDGDALAANSLKIVINATFGKFGDKYSNIYNPLNMLRVTLNAQFRLLQLYEALILEGIEIISLNTDGIFCKNNSKIDKAKTAWEALTKINLEKTPYESLYLKDSNAYFAKKANGKIKEKNKFFTVNPYYLGGGSVPIAPIKAVQAYFLEGTPLKESIEKNNNPLDFLKFGKYKGEKKLEYLSDSDSADNFNLSYKINRYYLSKSKRNAYKNKTKKSFYTIDSNINGGNILQKIDINDIDKKRYLEQAEKILKSLKPKKVSSFFDDIEETTEKIIKKSLEVACDGRAPISGKIEILQESTKKINRQAVDESTLQTGKIEILQESTEKKLQVDTIKNPADAGAVVNLQNPVKNIERGINRQKNEKNEPAGLILSPELKLIDTMLDNDEYYCVVFHQENFASYKILAKSEILREATNSKIEYICYNPVKDKGLGKGKANIKKIKAIALEADPQGELSEKELKASLLQQYNSLLALGVSYAVKSGNKSIHGIAIFKNPITIQQYEKIASLMKKAYVLPTIPENIMLDTSVLSDYSKFVRFPFGKNRKTGKVQEAIEINGILEYDAYLEKFAKYDTQENITAEAPSFLIENLEEVRQQLIDMNFIEKQGTYTDRGGVEHIGFYYQNNCLFQYLHTTESHKSDMNIFIGDTKQAVKCFHNSCNSEYAKKGFLGILKDLEISWESSKYLDDNLRNNLNIEDIESRKIKEIKDIAYNELEKEIIYAPAKSLNLVSGATGSGKTYSLIKYTIEHYVKTENKTVTFFVPTKLLLEEVTGIAKNFLANDDIGLFYSTSSEEELADNPKKKNIQSPIKRFNIAIMAYLGDKGLTGSRYEPADRLIKQSNIIIIDEAHRLFKDINLPLSASYKLGDKHYSIKGRCDGRHENCLKQGIDKALNILTDKLKKSNDYQFIKTFPVSLAPILCEYHNFSFIPAEAHLRGNYKQAYNNLFFYPLQENLDLEFKEITDYKGDVGYIAGMELLYRKLMSPKLKKHFPIDKKTKEAADAGVINSINPNLPCGDETLSGYCITALQQLLTQNVEKIFLLSATFDMDKIDKIYQKTDFFGYSINCINIKKLAFRFNVDVLSTSKNIGAYRIKQIIQALDDKCQGKKKRILIITDYKTNAQNTYNHLKVSFPKEVSIHSGNSSYFPLTLDSVGDSEGAENTSRIKISYTNSSLTEGVKLFYDVIIVNGGAYIPQVGLANIHEKMSKQEIKAEMYKEINKVETQTIGRVLRSKLDRLENETVNDTSKKTIFFFNQVPEVKFKVDESLVYHQKNYNENFISEDDKEIVQSIANAIYASQENLEPDMNIKEKSIERINQESKKKTLDKIASNKRNLIDREQVKKEKEVDKKEDLEKKIIELARIGSNFSQIYDKLHIARYKLSKQDVTMLKISHKNNYSK